MGKCAYTDGVLEATPRKKYYKRLVHGVGISDSSFSVSMKIDGKTVMHRAYSCWFEMLNRCYGEVWLSRYPSYRDCSVCSDWLTFSNFYRWWKENHIEGFELDKDIRIPGNRVYSPESCMFVPGEINRFFGDHKRRRGAYAIGVYFRSDLNKYLASVSDRKGGSAYLGLYEDERSAHIAWVAAKRLQLDGMKDFCDSVRPDLHALMLNKLNSMLVYCEVFK